MHKITDHKLSGLNDALEIAALDGPGPGGANHEYEIDIVGGAPESGGWKTKLLFQNGPIQDAGFNGISNEALLAVVIDRLRGFQHERNGDGAFNFNSRGKYACRENALALTDLESALMWLQKRTRDRMARGVEGTNKV
jgi:hypothetical protein